VRTRNIAQVRSHAQKYTIKLCKKYNIEIKSKRKNRFLTRHLNFPYIRKNKNCLIPLDKITKQDRFFLRTFNFYYKNIDFSKLDEVKGVGDIFKIEKTSKSQSTDHSVNVIGEEKIFNVASKVVSRSWTNVAQIDYFKRIMQLLKVISLNNNYMMNMLSQNVQILFDVLKWMNKEVQLNQNIFI
jgi:hypothetical protein